MNKQEMQEAVEKLMYSMKSGQNLKIVMKFVVAQCLDKNSKYIKRDFKMNDKMFPTQMERGTYNENRIKLIKKGFIKPTGRARFIGTELLEYFINSDEFVIFCEEY